MVFIDPATYVLQNNRSVFRVAVTFTMLKTGRLSDKNLIFRIINIVPIEEMESLLSEK